MEAMHRLADEIREVFSDRGHNIDKATSLDPAFRRSRGPQSALSRNLVLDTIEETAGRFGIGVIPVSGGGCDLQLLVDDADRRFRVRKATKVVDEETETETFDVIVDSPAILDITDAEIESLWRHERWIFGYTTDDGGIVDDIFAARAVRVTGDVIFKLVLADVTLLGLAGFSPDGDRFIPDDEDDLPGFDSDRDDDTGFAAGGTGA
ncbi:hypothetical protein [Nocardioides sp. L-11A]|uniref:hypothetical protein n=1 Tax=Nocardioides sp. L-11A TaxID=3043848 RepID=UPI00249C86F2|nr:hypothetical protein QJ852_06455 [Nocardioides sp. L-11A]